MGKGFSVHRCCGYLTALHCVVSEERRWRFFAFFFQPQVFEPLVNQAPVLRWEGCGNNSDNFVLSFRKNTLTVACCHPSGPCPKSELIKNVSRLLQLWCVPVFCCRFLSFSHSSFIRSVTRSFCLSPSISPSFAPCFCPICLIATYLCLIAHSSTYNLCLSHTHSHTSTQTSSHTVTNTHTHTQINKQTHTHTVHHLWLNHCSLTRSLFLSIIPSLSISI